jgi:DNA-binding LytR/AlgR family response regulator
MLRIAIVENEEKTSAQMLSFIRQFSDSHDQAISVDTFVRADVFLADYHPIYDIVFLGTEMPGLGGMEAARQLRQLDAHVVLVFVTGLARYVMQGYEVDALDVLIKPLNYYAFSVKLERAIQRVRQRTGEHIMIQAVDGLHRVDIRSIFYLETKNRMLHYHTSGGSFSVRASMQSAEDQLARYQFARCNQCYLVNLQHVTDVQDDFVIVAGVPLEMSRRSKKNFLAAVVAYIGGV